MPVFAGEKFDRPLACTECGDSSVRIDGVRLWLLALTA